MSPDGISLVEIGLNLPDTLYYLHWEPARPVERRTLLSHTRDTGRRMRWKILAADGDSDTARLLFQTTVDNLEVGLAALLRNTRAHRLYLVHPESAMHRIARCIHETDSAPGPGGTRHPARSTALPDVHYGVFMGERAWAERMLARLTSRAVDATDSGPAISLTEITRSHASNEDAILDAYRSGRFSLKDIAEHFDMHFSQVSAVVNAVGVTPPCRGSARCPDPSWP